MSLREKVNVLLAENKYDALTCLVLDNPGAMKYLFSYFYHPFGVQRWQAIEGLGCITEKMSGQNIEAVREILRRLLWSMNDESGSANWSAPEAIGEIIYRNPDLYQEYLSIVINASEEEIFHRGIIWALGRVGQKCPELVIEYLPLLVERLNHSKPEVRGYTAWALGQIGPLSVAALPNLKELLEDETAVEIYKNNVVTNVSVKQLVREAIQSITETMV